MELALISWMQSGNKPIYSKLFQFMKIGIKDIRAPIFKIQQLRELNDRITYRQINHWEDAGLISPGRVKEKMGWRQFSISETVVVLLISDLKEFGLSSAKVNEAVVSIVEPIKMHGLVFNQVEASIFLALAGKDMGLITDEHGGATILPNERWIRFFRKIDIWKLRYLYLPFSTYVQKVVSTFDLKLDIGGLNNTVFIDPKYQKIISLIESNEYSELEINMHDKDAIKIRATAEKNSNLSNDDLLKLLEALDFQRLELRKRNGKIASIRQEQRIRL